MSPQGITVTPPIDLTALEAYLKGLGIDIDGLVLAGDQLYGTQLNGGGGADVIELPAGTAELIEDYAPPEPETPVATILLALLEDVTDVDETKPIIAAMLYLLGGS